MVCQGDAMPLRKLIKIKLPGRRPPTRVEAGDLGRDARPLAEPLSSASFAFALCSISCSHWLQAVWAYHPQGWQEGNEIQ